MLANPILANPFLASSFFVLCCVAVDVVVSLSRHHFVLFLSLWVSSR